MVRLTDKDIVHIMDTVPERIRAARTRANMTQNEVATQIGVSRPAISQYESGTSDISIANLLRLSQILDVSLAELLGISLPMLDSLSPVVGEMVLLMNEISPKERERILHLTKCFLSDA